MSLSLLRVFQSRVKSRDLVKLLVCGSFRWSCRGDLSSKCFYMEHSFGYLVLNILRNAKEKTLLNLYLFLHRGKTLSFSDLKKLLRLESIITGQRDYVQLFYSIILEVDCKTDDVNSAVTTQQPSVTPTGAMLIMHLQASLYQQCLLLSSPCSVHSFRNI